MLEEMLTKEKGKILEFKENTKSFPKIIQTIVAFANTGGGTLIIGIKDKTKEVIGLANILAKEERIANAIADNEKCGDIVISENVSGDVPKIGLEPTYLTAPDPKSGVSTNFTTWALWKVQKFTLFQ